MIQSISIQGFKSLQNLENLELGQVNVFVGSNGSGKSNLLEAIGFLSAATGGGRVDSRELMSRGVRLSTPRLYRSSISAVADMDSTLTISATIRSGGQLLDYTASLYFPVDTSENSWHFRSESYDNRAGRTVSRVETSFQARSNETDPSTTVNWKHLPLESAAWLYFEPFFDASLLKETRTYAIYSPATPALRGLIPDPQQQGPVGLIGGRLADALEDLLHPDKELFGTIPLDEILDLIDWMGSFDVSAPSEELLAPDVPAFRKVVRFTDRWMRRGIDQLTGYDASEGALYVLFLLTLAVHPLCPRSFAVDNFDQCLNPRLARAVTRIFVREILASDPPRQVLLTTHSPQVLDGLDLTDDRVRLFAVERDSRGATQARRIRISQEYLDRHRDGQALSTLWVSGAIGGVPDL